MTAGRGREMWGARKRTEREAWESEERKIFGREVREGEVWEASKIGGRCVWCGGGGKKGIWRDDTKRDGGKKRCGRKTKEEKGVWV